MSYLIWSNPEHPQVMSCVLQKQELRAAAYEPSFTNNSRLQTNVRTCLGYQFSYISFVEGGKHRPSVERMS